MNYRHYTMKVDNFGNKTLAATNLQKNWVVNIESEYRMFDTKREYRRLV